MRGIKPERLFGNAFAHSRLYGNKLRKRLLRPEASKRVLGIASFFVLSGSIALSNLAPVAAAQSPSPSDQQVESSINEVTKFAEGSLKGQIEGQVADRLGEALEEHGFHWLWWGDKHWKSCKVVDKLTGLLDLIDRLRQRHPSDRLEQAFVKVWTLRNDILMSLPVGERCGFEDLGTEPRIDIQASDNKHVQFSVDFSQPMFTSTKGGNKTFTEVHMAGIDSQAGTPGEPAVPMWRKMIALPQGATAKIMQADAERAVGNVHINLVPFQEQPVDVATQGEEGENEEPSKPDPKDFANKPFVLNERTYAVDAFVPPNPCSIKPIGQHRDVQVALLECATAQYNPATDEYRILSGFDLDIAFEDGAENFVTNRTYGPFEPAASLTTDAVLNKAVIGRYVEDLDLSVLPCFGEELLILTHQNFRAAADTLATHKRNKGISTSVFNVGAGVPSRDTAEEIDDFIEDRYDDCKVRPSYVLLMGDAEFIPTFYPSGLADNPGTDYPYSTYVQILFDAFFPDFGTGRIPVDTLDQANTVVAKIVNYESDPPYLGIGNGAPFYTSVGLATQFQGFRMNPNGTPLNNQPGTDQRAFVETTEFVRNELLNQNYTAPRIYTRTVDNGGYCLQENASGDCIQTQQPYNGDQTPRRYYNGTLLPSAIGGGSGFAWNGNTTDIRNAWNDGRFLFLHRDHGWPGGWANPGFSSSDVDNLTNGDLLPVIFSVNCASGLFDNETAGGVYSTTNSGVYFAERALRKADGGAIGIIGDTRNSPTWANNALTRGFFDAVWPNTVPGANSSHKRLGDILNWGKIYLAGQMGVSQTAGSVSTDDVGLEYNIWHVIGDPTLEMWTRNPHKLKLSEIFTSQIGRLGELIKYDTDGVTITKLQISPDGEMIPIGRAVVEDGVADMKYFEQPNSDYQTVYAASLDDAVSVTLKQGGTDPGPRGDE